MAEFHHGISKREPTSGIIPMQDADTNVIGLIAFSDDADENVFPLDTPTLVTSINRALAASGTQGNLRASLETMSAITSPTLVFIRIENPFKGEIFNQSLVIGTTLPTGQRTGIQALLTAKSILGITLKINIAPGVETPEVVQALAAVNKKIRAFSYVTPRDMFGVMLETMQDVTAYRDTLSDREIMLIWPEFTSGNVLQGNNIPQPSGGRIDYTINGIVNTQYLKGAEFEQFKSLNITHVIVYEGVEYLGDGAFYDNKISGKLVFPESLQRIKQNTFAKNQISEIVLPTKLIELDSFAFANNQIKTVTALSLIPPTIGKTFASFSNNPLETIYVPAASVDAYKSAWDIYANFIQPLN
ncbi:leucine-rich repeat protein [Acinetobacter guillouiae]|uniref:leucine-rich repeat protein n=1 Tax=Acinetobacter guillouiae TaxID=106649 RepID=UPI001CD24822|nr:leucine-rich repeat protein [Acinetobacter guillouiae]